MDNVKLFGISITIVAVMANFSVASASLFVNVSITGLGIVQGTRNNNAEIFKGIPFAEAPTGDLRFKPPKPARWSGFRNATRFGNVCPQREYSSSRLVLNEDCLYLNIYRPAKRNGKLAVMVWIHGGSYIYGSASDYDGETLAARNGVIVVTIQYRLGVLGFFNIPNTDMKGNFGMLDQIEALRWVKKNIANFDGNPTKVTIFGVSAGGTSVSLLTLSPMIKDEGLFARAIAQSGVASNFWAVKKVTNDKMARYFGGLLQCNDVEKLVNCLKSKTTREIILKQELVASTNLLTSPVVDGNFLAELPSKQVAKNTLPKSHVPLMVGFTKDEGTYFAGDPRSCSKQSYEQTVKVLLKRSFGNENKILETTVIHEYTRYLAGNLALKWFDSTSDIYGDSVFNVDTINFADSWFRSGNAVYMYLFSHLPENLVFPQQKVAHGFERPYVFGYATVGSGWLYQKNYTAIDRNVSVQCMEMWVSFAKHGFPGKGWPKYRSDTRNYLNIKNPLTIESQLWPDRMAFWNKVVTQIRAGTKPQKCEDKAKASSIAVEGLLSLLLLCILFNQFVL